MTHVPNLTPVFIRNAVPSDYEACKKIANQKENCEGLGFVSRVTFNDFAMRQIHEPRFMLQVAINRKGDIVGYIRALRLKTKDQTTIHEVCRDANRKKQGIGKRLIQHVIETSVAHDVGKVVLKTPADAKAANLYPKYGFSLTSTEQPAGRRKRVLRRYEMSLKA